MKPFLVVIFTFQIYILAIRILSGDLSLKIIIKTVYHIQASYSLEIYLYNMAIFKPVQSKISFYNTRSPQLIFVRREKNVKLNKKY